MGQPQCLAFLKYGWHRGALFGLAIYRKKLNKPNSVIVLCSTYGLCKLTFVYYRYTKWKAPTLHQVLYQIADVIVFFVEQINSCPPFINSNHPIKYHQKSWLCFQEKKTKSNCLWRTLVLISIYQVIHPKGKLNLRYISNKFCLISCISDGHLLGFSEPSL